MCASPDFQFVLSWIHSKGKGTAVDVGVCGAARLPMERKMVVGRAGTKGDAAAREQGVVVGKLVYLP